jgi:Cytochrome c7 and related cytochrome c
MSLALFHHRGLMLMLVTALLPLCDIARTTARNSTRPQRSSARPGAQKKVAPQRKPSIDYTKFSHQTHFVEQKLSCDSCHKLPSKNWKVVRPGDAAFPDVTDFPEHASCLNCHRQQFFARERPAPAICSNCHIAVTPRDTTRWVFPALGDLTDLKLKRREFVSEFGVGFPHDKHIDVVGRLTVPSRWRDRGRFVNASLQEKKKQGPPASCPVCHLTYQPQGNSSEEYVTKPPKNLGDNFWLKKGTFKTIPNSHTACFSCHSADSGVPPEPKDCNVCHKLVSPGNKLATDFDLKLASDIGVSDKTILRAWSHRISAGAFRHEAGEHPDLSCLNCHDAANASFNTIDVKTLRVPVQSCGGAEGCHITATTDEGGILNFEIDQRKKDPKFVCTKCHITFGKEAIPVKHASAIPTPKPIVKPG